jgi:hypothetical protein
MSDFNFSIIEKLKSVLGDRNMEDHIFSILISIILALIGFIVKNIYDKIKSLEERVVEHGESLARIEAVLGNGVLFKE